MQGLHLAGMLLEIVNVLVDARQLVQHHAALQATLDRRPLVVPEVDSARRSEQREDPVQLLVAERGGVRGCLVAGRVDGRAPDVGVPCDLDQLGRDALGRKHEIDHAGRDRGPRHPVVLRGRWLLGDRDAADGFDVADADGAVGGGAGEHDADRAVAGGLGERAQQEIDGNVLGGIVRPRHEMQAIVRDGHPYVRRNDIDRIRLDPHALGGLPYRERGHRGEEGRERALVVRCQMLHVDEGDVGGVGQRGEQRRKGFEPARRGPDADDRRGRPRPRHIGRRGRRRRRARSGGAMCDAWRSTTASRRRTLAGFLPFHHSVTRATLYRAVQAGSTRVRTVAGCLAGWESSSRRRAVVAMVAADFSAPGRRQKKRGLRRPRS